jgi:hypothetical protein
MSKRRGDFEQLDTLPKDFLLPIGGIADVFLLFIGISVYAKFTGLSPFFLSDFRQVIEPAGVVFSNK